MQYFKDYFNRFSIKVPFRMMVGRFGIKLAKFGRILQTRYANWNREFRLKREFFNAPHTCDLHVSESILNGERVTLTFHGPEGRPGVITPLVKDLFNEVRGLEAIILGRYCITLKKGHVFDWGEILPAAEEVVLRHCTTK